MSRGRGAARVSSRHTRATETLQQPYVELQGKKGRKYNVGGRAPLGVSPCLPASSPPPFPPSGRPPAGLPARSAGHRGPAAAGEPWGLHAPAQVPVGHSARAQPQRSPCPAVCIPSAPSVPCPASFPCSLPCPLPCPLCSAPCPALCPRSPAAPSGPHPGSAAPPWIQRPPPARPPPPRKPRRWTRTTSPRSPAPRARRRRSGATRCATSLPWRCCACSSTGQVSRPPPCAAHEANGPAHGLSPLAPSMRRAKLVRPEIAPPSGSAALPATIPPRDATSCPPPAARPGALPPQPAPARLHSPRSRPRRPGGPGQEPERQRARRLSAPAAGARGRGARPLLARLALPHAGAAQASAGLAQQRAPRAADAARVDFAAGGVARSLCTLCRRHAHPPLAPLPPLPPLPAAP